jgi:hypothetical protein
MSPLPTSAEKYAKVVPDNVDDYENDENNRNGVTARSSHSISPRILPMAQKPMPKEKEQMRIESFQAGAEQGSGRRIASSHTIISLTNKPQRDEALLPTNIPGMNAEATAADPKPLRYADNLFTEHSFSRYSCSVSVFFV